MTTIQPRWRVVGALLLPAVVAAGRITAEDRRNAGSLRPTGMTQRSGFQVWTWRDARPVRLQSTGVGTRRDAAGANLYDRWRPRS